MRHVISIHGWTTGPLAAELTVTLSWEKDENCANVWIRKKHNIRCHLAQKLPNLLLDILLAAVILNLQILLIGSNELTHLQTSADSFFIPNRASSVRHLSAGREEQSMQKHLVITQPVSHRLSVTWWQPAGSREIWDMVVATCWWAFDYQYMSHLKRTEVYIAYLGIKSLLKQIWTSASRYFMICKYWGINTCMQFQTKLPASAADKE